MKIGICLYPTYGGSGAMATELGIKLSDRGHEVHFVSYAQPFRLPSFKERVFFHEVEMAEYPLLEHPPYSLALAVTLHRTAVDHGLDLIHVHYAIPHATSAWIANQMLGENRIKVITTLHGTDITLVGQQPSYQPITQFSILKSDGLTTVSHFLRDETVRDFNVAPERIEVIPNFVDPEIWHPDRQPCHRSALAPGGEKILMHVSNFRAVKRVSDTIEILARVREKVPARLVLVGDGPERVRAEERAAEMGVADDVVFLGKHLSVDELLPCADTFLLPSESESFGLAALEALACGAPVVASRVGGLPEVVEEGVSGFLLPVRDIEGMSEAVVELLSDAEMHRSMSRQGRQLAVERFSAERVVPVYEAYYERVLSDADLTRVG